MVINLLIVAIVLRIVGAAVFLIGVSYLLYKYLDARKRERDKGE